MNTSAEVKKKKMQTWILISTPQAAFTLLTSQTLKPQKSRWGRYHCCLQWGVFFCWGYYAVFVVGLWLRQKNRWFSPTDGVNWLTMSQGKKKIKMKELGFLLPKTM